MHKVFLLLSLVLLVGGCAGVATLPLNNLISSTPAAGSLEIHQSTDVRLEQGNFVVVRTNVVGQSKGFALLGIITMVPAQFNKAMNRLYSQAGMEMGRPQTLAGLAMEKN